MEKLRPKVKAYNRKNKFLKKGRELLNETNNNKGENSSKSMD